MDVFLYILTHNILPIICIVCLGFLMGKKFPMDVKTLSKLNFYVFVPTFTFYQIYTTALPDSMLWVLISFESSAGPRDRPCPKIRYRYAQRVYECTDVL